MTVRHVLFVAALALPLVTLSCGGRSTRSAKTAATPASMESGGQCYDRGAPEPSADGDSPSSEASGDYDADCYSPDADADADPDLGRGEDEISRLWNEIREQRLAAGLPGEPLLDATRAVTRLSVTEVQKREHADPKSQNCISTCKIEDSICKNADSICRLAANLGNDWATEKCNSGKASCQEANEKCADCVEGESP
jgi:hypothetical protein